MLGRQKQVLEALHRVSEFLRRNPAEEGTPAGRLYQEFRETTARVERAAAHQDTGHRLSRAATQELRAAVRQLRKRHLKPIATIARASADRLVGIEKACALPRHRLPVTVLAAEAMGVRDGAQKHAEWFVSLGRDPEFVSQLDAAIADLRERQLKRARAKQLHVGATAAMAEHLRRARSLLEILDCHVRAAVEEDEGRLAEWRVARRVQLKPGGRRVGESDVEVVALEEVRPASALAMAA